MCKSLGNCFGTFRRYCDCCRTRLFDQKSTQPNVPFRDEHSAQTMKNVPDPSKAVCNKTQLEQSDAQRWARKKREHAQTAGGRYSLTNLVPTSQPSRWQNAPHVPFDMLQTHTAQSRLSLCKLDSSIEPGGMQGGRTVYASQRGDSNFWRRNPQQVSGTLAFMLTRDECAEFQLRAEEIPHVQECLRFLRASNPLFKVFWANVERFGMLYQKLQAALPQGDLKTPIRVNRNRPCQ